MKKFILISFLSFLVSCQSESETKQKSDAIERNILLITPQGKEVKTTLAITDAEQAQGLSGVKADEFSDDQAMMFFNLEDDERNFWMPDTYFDLDIIYLDKNLKIIDIVRKLPHHVGRGNPELIPRSRPVWARHALEMKASSKISQGLNLGEVLIWKGAMSLKETEDESRKIILPKKN